VYDSLSISGGMMMRAEMLTHVCVGISMVIIGLLGIRESKEWSKSLYANCLSAAAVAPAPAKKRSRAIIFNGLLHGFSVDGTPSLAPALAVASWRGNIGFLLSYAVGTIIAMAFTTTVIGEGTSQVGSKLGRPDVPMKLSYASSVFACLVGVVWTAMAVAR